MLCHRLAVWHTQGQQQGHTVVDVVARMAGGPGHMGARLWWWCWC